MVVLGHLVLADRIAPATEKAFIEWWEPLTRLGGTHWLRGEQSVVRIGGISGNATALMDLTLFERDAAGRLVAQVDAGSATFADGHWQLHDVREFVLGGVTRSILKQMTVPVLMSH